jgi:hypothetical protein
MAPIIRTKRSSSRRIKEDQMRINNNSSMDNEETIEDQPKSQVTSERISKNEITNTNNIEICFDYLKKFLHFAIRTVKFIIKISGVYILWIILHFASSHLYIRFCVPSTFMGFIISPFMTSSPHCQGLRWIIYNGANTINNMWVILGTWICSYLIQLGSANKDE